MSRRRDSECVVCSGEPGQSAEESCAVLRKVTQGIEDADQSNRRKLLVVGGLLFLMATAILNGVLNDRADNEAAALRSDVEQAVASLGDTSPAGFWMFDESDPPSTAPDGRSMLVTGGGIEPASMAFDRGQTFVLYRIETWGKERCVRVVFQASGVEIGEKCVLVDRTE